MMKRGCASCAVALAVVAGGTGACRSKAPAQTDPGAVLAPLPAVAAVTTFTMPRLDGTPTPLSAWSGQVLLVVNTASECGFTPQYEGLEALHERYSARGFAVLGFPANDFGAQEPGSATEIAAFCKTKYGVTFPMFAKVVTVGPEQSPLYAALAARLGAPKWNFHKYLIDRHGTPMEAFPSSVDPSSPLLARAIEEALTAQ